nr:GDP-mannose 4,6-dehydratase [Paenibacillus sedimenti]
MQRRKFAFLIVGWSTYTDSKFTTYIVKSCLQQVPELQLTPGNQKRDFIHVHDVVSAYSLLLKQLPTNFPWFREFEIGTGTTTTVRHFVELVHQLSQSGTKLYFGAIPHREHEIMESIANISELRKLGWNHKISLQQGIKYAIMNEKNRNRLN